MPNNNFYPTTSDNPIPGQQTADTQPNTPEARPRQSSENVAKKILDRLTPIQHFEGQAG